MEFDLAMDSFRPPPPYCVQVSRLERGGYFGELALLTHRPRAANVVAVTDVKLACLSTVLQFLIRHSDQRVYVIKHDVTSHLFFFFLVLEVNAFERLLGPCKNIMKRNARAYEDQMAAVLGRVSPQDLR